jgi:hypothetical protein
MAKNDDSPMDVSIQAVPAGSVTTVNGQTVKSYVPGDQQPPHGPTGPGYPVVMPQPSVIVVTVGKDGEKKPKKGYSDVFKRP